MTGRKVLRALAVTAVAAGTAFVAAGPAVFAGLADDGVAQTQVMAGPEPAPEEEVETGALARARDGRAPASGRVSLIARTPTGSTALVAYRSQGGSICLGLLDAGGGRANCPAELNTDDKSAIYANAATTGDESYILGFVPAGTMSLEVASGPERGPVRLIQGPGPSRGTTFFLGTASAFNGPLELVARNADGQIIATKQIGGHGRR